MDPELKDNLRKRQTWLRGLYMVLFVLAFHVAEFVLGAVVLLQFLFTLFTGDTNQRLLQFGENLSEYVYQILRFLTFNTEEMPFPFSDWPDASKRIESNDE